MHAKLKGLHSPDILDLERWSPSDPAHFGFLLQARIGPSDSEGAESFDIQVCTPSWFAEKLGPEDVRSGGHMLFMKQYDYRRLVDFIARYCQACDGQNWNQVAQKLSHLGNWEFTNYRV